MLLQSAKAKRVLTPPAALAPTAAYPLCTFCRNQPCRTLSSAAKGAASSALRILRKQHSSCTLQVDTKQLRFHFQGRCWGCAASPDRSHHQQGRLRSIPADSTHSPWFSSAHPNQLRSAEESAPLTPSQEFFEFTLSLPGQKQLSLWALWKVFQGQ